jgi:hypothetical protein
MICQFNCSLLPSADNAAAPCESAAAAAAADAALLVPTATVQLANIVSASRCALWYKKRGALLLPMKWLLLPLLLQQGAAGTYRNSKQQALICQFKCLRCAAQG